MTPTPAKPAAERKAAKPEKAARTARSAEKPAAKPAERPAAEVAQVVAAEKPAGKGKAKASEAKVKASSAETIKLRALVDAVATATKAKKPEAKKSVEAVLAAIADGLAARSVLVLPPLGKLRVAKANGGVLTLKLRLADSARGKGLALADDGEDD